MRSLLKSDWWATVPHASPVVRLLRVVRLVRLVRVVRLVGLVRVVGIFRLVWRKTKPGLEFGVSMELYQKVTVG